MSYQWHPAPKKKPPRPACIGCTHYQGVADGAVFHGYGRCAARDGKSVEANERRPCALYQFHVAATPKPGRKRTRKAAAGPPKGAAGRAGTNSLPVLAVVP